MLFRSPSESEDEVEFDDYDQEEDSGSIEDITGRIKNDSGSDDDEQDGYLKDDNGSDSMVGDGSD